MCRLEVPRGLGVTSDEFGPALGDLVEKTVKVWYDAKKIPPEERVRMDGYRKNGIQAVPRYKARPLDGVWAAPPYLHNGSVPTIYALLSPAAERPATFHLGHREYDPEKAGYRHDTLQGGFELDTKLRGNRNTGHAFDDKPATPFRRRLMCGEDDTPAFEKRRNQLGLLANIICPVRESPKGVIGARLAPEERRALVEFLKTDCVNDGRLESDSPTSCERLGVPTSQVGR